MYILAFAVIMLNTDLHTPSLKDSRRMKLDEFIKNLCRVEEGKNLDKFGFFFNFFEDFEIRRRRGGIFIFPIFSFFNLLTTKK